MTMSTTESPARANFDDTDIHYGLITLELLDDARKAERLVADLNHIVPMMSSSFQGITLEQLRYILEMNTMIFGAWHGDRLVATVCLTPIVILVGIKYTVEDVVTDTLYRSRGISRWLMELVLAWVGDPANTKFGRVKCVDLTSKKARIPARQFYLGLGFRVRDESDVFRYAVPTA